MKTIIVILNIILAGVLLTSIVSSLKSVPAGKNAVKPGVAAKKAQNTRKGTAAAETKSTEPGMTSEQQVSAILSADLFNPERTPNATTGGRGNRVELSLVGTFQAGEIEGAVILYKTTARQTNPFMRMIWGGGAPEGPRGPGNNDRRGVRRFAFANQNNQNNRRQNTTAVKQYVRLGETLPNGYTLTALSRTRATLTRGGDKMDLELQDPSKNQNAARRTRSTRLSANQQLQQAQLATQRMMVRMLMDMRNQGNSDGGNRGGGNRGGGARRGR